MRVCHIGITLTLMCCSVFWSPDSWAEQSTKPGNGRTSSATYGGGGVRGATAEAPDGFLVTREEMLMFNQNDNIDKDAPKRSRSIQPEMDIIALPSGQALINPVTVHIAFRHLENAPLDASSVRVFYGQLKVDITPRTQALTQLTPQGFSLSGLYLPNGQHLLFIEAQDTQGRRVQTSLTLNLN